MVSAWLAGLLALASPVAAAMPEPPAGPPYTLPRSVERVVHAPDGEAYRLFVAWPEAPPPPSGYPVLYVLDGEDNFAIAALTARRLAGAGARSGVGEGIVVGIAAGSLQRRARDYTPATPGWTIPANSPGSGWPTGGAEAFLDLVERQVQPFVRQHWRVDRSRETLLGHSFGGLLALHAALTRPAMFGGVVAVSPSLWFGNGLIAREAATAGASHPRILIAEGDAAAAPPAELARSLDRGGGADHARFLPLPGQSHGTTMLAAMAPAIRFAFARAAP
ncbi:putative alpha/beta superfamily hydrolase [Sphingomonas sp. SORGH_AS870]|uniref:alpha/beta hydrolase n=1 Tax=Sphingomonas sp. SORGH_AS_0870 TaxID=3041801 RepID=UPI0028643A74|nr:alpha/beta hydrolase-fold protein [Sphingomonas sp. SORGH_AS_0870]MDR6145786.1 putative alpha/beta superfamily hydrolase [Sphingomonas sp. SORGH_AS_0870]